jgi:hypothetical protein
MMNFSTGVLAHLGSPRAYALQGDTGKSRTAYQDFFALWKDADPDVPILKEALARTEDVVSLRRQPSVNPPSAQKTHNCAEKTNCQSFMVGNSQNGSNRSVAEHL